VQKDNQQIYIKIESCRLCGSKDLQDILDLGDQPPANSLREDVDASIPSAPLKLIHCGHCSVVQLTATVDPAYLFSQYLWVTATSTTARGYSETFCNEVLKRSSINSPFVVEIAKSVQSGDIVSCMGSFPNGVDQKSIQELVEAIHAVGGKIVFDSSPEFLGFALAAGVDIVSPNLDEAESLLQGKSADLFIGDLTNAQERAEVAAKALLEKGAEVGSVYEMLGQVLKPTEIALFMAWLRRNG
jgi:hypothetical protein